MRSSNYASSLVCVMALAMACTTLAQNSPQDFVDAHNSARAAVGVGPVSWDDNVTAYAQNYSNQRISDCQLVNSGGPYGENLFSGNSTEFTGIDAVNTWVDEKQYYDYDSNSCAEGQVCETYTQVVWRDSTAIDTMLPAGLYLQMIKMPPLSHCTRAQPMAVEFCARVVQAMAKAIAHTKAEAQFADRIISSSLSL